MKKMRLAHSEDIVRLKEIWQRCFGDTDSFIDFYYTYRFKAEQTAVYLQDNSIAAMLTMIPIQWVDDLPEAIRIDGAMLYAIATHPDFQHQGIATELMDWAKNYLRDQQVELCVLVPAEAHLYKFYARQGYQEGFIVQETVLSCEEMRAMADSGLSCSVRRSTPQGYNEIRNQLLRGSLYIAYGEEEIAYQKRVSQLSGEDIYEFNLNGAQGCAAVERMEKERVLVKELLLPEKLIPGGLAALAQKVDAEEFIIRTPVGCKTLGGQTRPFGMLTTSNTELLGKNGYLGLAFD
ncbi:acetyltransferase [Desulfitobacterium dichloroeliminans LMG P-21439]|uniref:Acetyltransferase n=1 Tax=Desulfitobacterium dichloroeliminans (strain LMG P-21439 / DCA1) TaxID=871963 RepID=L0F813_DESDL|nr:GNAT family N-acetyltransferase [Desulfitobacterium dichloroeliminans]AGA69068.1 acetyltransferase [Desulfitobacterium dichloroeliminans LMG P-21439]